MSTIRGRGGEVKCRGGQHQAGRTGQQPAAVGGNLEDRGDTREYTKPNKTQGTLVSIQNQTKPNKTQGTPVSIQNQT